jgi:hypothetical protein
VARWIGLSVPKIVMGMFEPEQCSRSSHRRSPWNIGIELKR